MRVIQMNNKLNNESSFTAKKRHNRQRDIVFGPGKNIGTKIVYGPGNNKPENIIFAPTPKDIKNQIKEINKMRPPIVITDKDKVIMNDIASYLDAKRIPKKGFNKFIENILKIFKSCKIKRNA